MMHELAGCVAGARRPYAIDAFPRANGALGDAEYGGTWLVSNGTVTIVSNKAKGGTSGTTNMATLVMPQLDYDISVEFTFASGEVLSVIARSDTSAAQNFIRLRYDGTKIEIIKTISGTSTSLASYNYTWTSGTTHKLGLSCRGNFFSGFLDDVEVVTVTDDNATKTLPRAGFGLYKATGVPASTANVVSAMGC